MARAAALATILCALNAVTAAAQAVTAVEHYNTGVDAYCLTGCAKEQVLLDGAADFQRTGMTFQAVTATAATSAQTRICRFYISTTTAIRWSVPHQTRPSPRGLSTASAV
jgi:hypothetical protein